MIILEMEQWLAPDELMLETIAIVLMGLIPGVLASYLATTGIRRYRRERRYYQTFGEPSSIQLLQPYLPSQDYHYVEGLGYMVGDLSCQFNARSPYLRCAVNPSGPCQGCSSYEALHFPEEPDDSQSMKFNS
ncbi:MAG: DUF6464 family protein [Leptolyngbyaceae cyanobacterium bins.302]|nr:DUF6464 family protein [Leptolyngbyaceae cyanobacterium bins.302]